MRHYIDIRLLPDPDFAPHQLLAALYAKLHRALVQHQTDRIAVSFPGYALQQRTLGDTLRLIGPHGELDTLVCQDGWLQAMRDHCQISTVTPTPTAPAHRTLRRVQAKSSPDRLRRRQMRRHGLTAEQAAQRVPDRAAELLDLPFIAMRSTSTGQPFNLYLRLSAMTVEPTAEGPFNSYGLSATASVPWF